MSQSRDDTIKSLAEAEAHVARFGREIDAIQGRDIGAESLGRARKSISAEAVRARFQEAEIEGVDAYRAACDKVRLDVIAFASNFAKLRLVIYEPVLEALSSQARDAVQGAVSAYNAALDGLSERETT